MAVDRARAIWASLLALVTTSAIAGTLSATPPFGLPSTYATALGISLAAPPAVALGALFTDQFDQDAYVRARGRSGVATCAALIIASSAVAGLVVASLAGRLSVSSPTASVLVLIAVYMVAFAVFTVRNVSFYEGASARAENRAES